MTSLQSPLLVRWTAPEETALSMIRAAFGDAVWPVHSAQNREQLAVGRAKRWSAPGSGYSIFVLFDRTKN